MGDPVVEYAWHDSAVPAGLRVTQVHGWLLCPVTGRVLVQEQDDGTFSLPSGTPEPCDAGRYATLAREAFEENQVRVGERAVYLGFQEVGQPGRPVIAQVRMAGIIAGFAARAPDPDSGRLNRRHMTSLAAAPALLGWGEPGHARLALLRKPGASGDCRSAIRLPTGTRIRSKPPDTSADTAPDRFCVPENLADHVGGGAQIMPF